jgi:hypothetical protein
MKTRLNDALILQAFARLGIELDFKQERNVDSALVGTMVFIEFSIQRPYRTLTLSPCDENDTVTAFVEDGVTNRAIYNLDARCMFSIDSFMDALKRQPAMLATLKGAPVVNTPIDWHNYRRKEDE